METLTRVDDILNQARDWLKNGDRVALATVISTWGSSPRPVGSQLAINEHGAFVGSVSGGGVEGAVVDSAKSIIAGAEPAILEFSVSDEQAMGVGLTCGGTLKVFVTAVHDPSLLSQLCEHLANRVPVCVVMSLDSGEFSLVTGDGICGASAVSDQTHDTALSMLKNGEIAVLAGAGESEVFAHSIIPPPRLFIVGAGHITQALAPMAQIAGFEVSVIDPRTAFTTAERFPQTDLSTLWPDDYFRLNPPDAHSALVTLVHDPKIDDPALESALYSDMFYIGALGSRKTHRGRVDRLRIKNFTDQDMMRIHAPVGLDLGGRKPAEIAVSIIAEIVQAWNGVE